MTRVFYPGRVRLSHYDAGAWSGYQLVFGTTLSLEFHFSA